MKIRIIAAAFAGLVTLAVTAPASAQVHYREHRQEYRIHQGERSGALTRREAWRLQHQQRRIHRREALLRRRDGGRLTPHDRRMLGHRQNVASRHIYRHKHNWQHRG